MSSAVRLSEGDLHFLIRFVEQRAGIRLSPAKASLLEARLTAVVLRRGLPSVHGLVDRLRATPSDDLVGELLDAVSSHETGFFRDPRVFEHLSNELIPRLVKQRAQRRSLTIWSAGCSTGQEPYSLAMLLRDRFGELAGWSVSILGTDLSDAAVRRAGAAEYSDAEVARGLSRAVRDRHLERLPSGWRVRPETARLATFRRMNLIEPWDRLPQADLILMRNVLVCFSVETQRAILRRAASVLAPDGMLMLGLSEVVDDLADRFEVADPRVGLYARSGPGTSLGIAV